MLFARIMILCVCGFAAILASSLITTRAGAAEQTTLFALPPATQAHSITVGPDGNIWFSGVHAIAGFEADAVIGRVSPKGAVSEFVLPPGRSAGQIVAGPDGNLWFTQTLFNKVAWAIAKIGRITPTGKFAEYRLDNAAGSTNSITVGPDGNLWFTERFERFGRPHSVVGRISTSGKVTRFPLSARNVPGAIVAGPDGNLWFTERGLAQRQPGRRRGVSKIGRITPTGRITQFPLPNRKMIPRSIAVGPDGNLWFTEEPVPYSQPGRRNKIGRITLGGVITEFPVPGKGGTGKIAAGPGGNISFTTTLDEGRRFAIGSVTPTGRLREVTCLKNDCELILRSLTEGLKGDLWFAADKKPIEKVAYSLEAGFVGKFSSSS